MSMLKKVIGVLIVFLLLQVSVVIMQSHAADEDIFKGVDISKNGDGSVVANLSQDQTTLTISGTGEMKDWDYENYSNIPWFNNYSTKITTVKINQGVTSIGRAAFKSCSSLSRIELPSSVTSIGYAAFSDCSSLSSITIPSSVTSIGGYAFYKCSSLSSITIPSSVTSIGDYALLECSSLSSITVDSNNTKYTSEDGVLFNKEKTNIIKYPAKKEGESYKIPSGVTSIEGSAFFHCSSLSSINIPSGVTSIGQSAFSGCSSLSSIELPSNVTSIGRAAFYGCSSLSSIELPSSVKSIESYAFIYCSSLSSIELPSSVISIGEYAFAGCSSLSSVELPSSVTSIGEYAFSGCSSLSSIEIPSGVTSIRGKAFDGCNSLRSINVSQENINYASEDGVLFNKEKTNIIKYPAKKEGESYKIPSGVTSIGENAFKSCSSLNGIELPSSVTSIGGYAFYNCSSLSSIELPSSVTSIGENAFRGCSGLSSINIPSSVTSIGDAAFSECSSLSSIDIPSSVTSIGGGAFSGCSSLSSIELPSSVTSIGNYAFKSCSSLRSIEIPSGVTGIGFSAFLSCSSLSSIELPSSVTSIGDNAFWGCSSLISINIPSSVTSIGDYAFYNCSSLSSIELPSSVTGIGSYAFSGCSSLRSIEIPSSVTSIGNSAFMNCHLFIKTISEEEITIPNILKRAMTENDILYTTKEVTLTNCMFSENKDKIKINKSNSSEISIRIHDGALKGLTIIIVPLENIDISKNNDGSVMAQISEDMTTLTISGTGEMKSWSKLSDIPWYSYREEITIVKINQGVTNIGGSAFYGCSSISSIELPSSVMSIGDGAFSECSSLSSITVDLNNPKYTSEDGVLFNKNKTVILKYPLGKENSNYTIPSSVTSIGGYAFSYCSSLNSIELPSSVMSIGDGAFKDCSSLSSIELPSGVTSIGYGAFYSCSSLSSIEIPNSVTTIGQYAFFHCSSLSSIELPSGVTSIGAREFIGCSSLSSIAIDSNNPKYTSEDGVLYNKEKTKIIKYPAKKEGESYTIPSNVTSIGQYAFSGCSSLNGIIIPKEVTSIGDSAFNSCSNLTITCKGGTTVETYAKDNNIKYVVDNELKVKEINYSTKELTNQNVTVTITGEEESRQINGWNLSEDRKTLTKTYKANTEDEITILDLVGNERTEKITINNIELISIEINTYTIENNIIKDIQPSTSYTDFIKNITSNKEIVVKEGNKTVTGTNKIKTGQVLTAGEKKYMLVVTGDTNGDGQADIKDILQINKHRLNKARLTNEYFTAGDVNKDGKVDIKDILQLNKYRLGKISQL